MSFLSIYWYPKKENDKNGFTIKLESPKRAVHFEGISNCSQPGFLDIIIYNKYQYKNNLYY